MNRTQKFIYNSVSTALLQIVVMIVGFVLPRAMLKYYGSEINGLVSSITQFMTYFSLVEAGLAGAAVYSLYKPLAEKNSNKINEIVSLTKKFYYKSGLIFSVLVMLLAIFYPMFVTTNLLSKGEIFLLIFVIGLSVVIDFFTLSKYRVLLTADQKVYVISIASIIYYLVNTAIIVILASMKLNIILVRLIAILAVILRSIILYLYVKKNYENINYNVKSKNKDLLNKRWDALYLQILGSIQQGAPVIILTLIKNLTTVSVYTIYNMIMSGINGVLSIFTSGLSSSFGDVIARGETETLKKVTEEFEYIYYNIITIIYTTALIMIMPFIKIYTSGISDANYYLPAVGALFVLNGLLYNLKTPQGMLVISAGMYKETRWQSTIQGLVIIILGLLLTPKFGLVGILIASILSNLYRTIDLLIFIPKNLTKLPIKITLLRQIKVFIYGTIIYLLTFFIKINARTYVMWAIYAVIVVIIGCVVVFVLDLIIDRKQLRNVFKRLKGMIKRNG